MIIHLQICTVFYNIRADEAEHAETMQVFSYCLSIPYIPYTPYIPYIPNPFDLMCYLTPDPISPSTIGFRFSREI